MATRGTIRLTNLQKGQIQAARIRARAKRDKSLDKKATPTRKKSLNDIDEQRRRLLASMTPEQRARFGNRVEDAAEKYVNNIERTKTYKRDLQKTDDAYENYRKNKTVQNSVKVNSLYEDLGDRKYSRRAYMGLSEG